jgi:hypothetical protein
MTFDDLRGLLGCLRYNERIFRQARQPEIIDLQPLKDGKAKPYQVRQVHALFQKYGVTSVP